MTSSYSLDKTKCWFAIAEDDGVVHCYHHEHRLCDSAPAGNAASVVTDNERRTCGKCLERLNTAVHDGRGSHYGER